MIGSKTAFLHPGVFAEAADPVGGLLPARPGRPLHAAAGVHQLANHQPDFRLQLSGQGALFLRKQRGPLQHPLHHGEEQHLPGTQIPTNFQQPAGEWIFNHH